ncbi:class I SAM-dependent methyltransferase [Rhodopirellula baltica]|uniref:Tellurite resistance protein TehB n=2 Tax=Rhodopirellula baltica TaxID=265606 RepID=F2AKK3_RHOBT|nr:class I SAM-dependent methyltransferase [Rhodopirellula baltica]EGF29825.1 tellurite resistance protein TehB [Rhodopirellula baltica WH47]EKK02538.1 protein containing Methyltransferase type 11 domain protein [Rhodopirellula baltica SH28]
MNRVTDDPSNDFFFEAYDRENIAYGMQPSPELAAYLKQTGAKASTYTQRPKAIDLGAGAGRDTLALAAAGYDVTSVDVSERGLDRIRERAERADLSERIQTVVCDVRELSMEANQYAAVIATTVLDHIPGTDAPAVWKKMCASLTDHGMLYAQVHTTEDPGSNQSPGKESDQPVSETAGAVINYFRPNQLVGWACDPDSKLRVLRYEERLEWDTTHGAPHQHGKAVLLAVRHGFHPEWFGQPAAFPRPEQD